MSDIDTSDFNLADLTRFKQDEVARQMTICNACRYCEGLCAVFPAMELRRSFESADVDYLSNLCHNCGACYEACQYVAPHEFDINVPKAMAELREDTYQRYVWPIAFSGLFRRNALWIGLSSIIFIVVFVVGILIWYSPAPVFTTYVGKGAFYALIPHELLVAIFGALFVYAVLAMAMSVRRFWRTTHGREKVEPGTFSQAFSDTAKLRYLHGGGPGCTSDTDRPSSHRRWYHHATAYGFLLCFASTSLGTICHYAGYIAPYAFWHPVVILGTLGGIGLLVGPVGLIRAHRQLTDNAQNAADIGLVFLVVLVATSLSGLAVLVLRATPLMHLMLMIHLGIVAAFFISMPYGKFVHGLHRVVALVRYAHEQRMASRQT